PPRRRRPDRARVPRPPSLTPPGRPPRLAPMRLSSRASIAIAAILLAAPTFRPTHAAGIYRVASVRPSDPRSPLAQTRERQLIVQFRADADDRDVARVTRQAGAERVRRSAYGNRYLVTLDAGFSPAEAMRRLSDQPEVEYSEPNGSLHAFFHP